MFEELFTDWRFLLAAAAIVLAIGEARYKIRRHDALLNEDKIAEWNRQQATLLADVKNTSEDMHEMKKDLETIESWSNFDPRELDEEFDRDEDTQ